MAIVNAAPGFNETHLRPLMAIPFPGIAENKIPIVTAKQHAPLARLVVNQRRMVSGPRPGGFNSAPAPAVILPGIVQALSLIIAAETNHPAPGIFVGHHRIESALSDSQTVFYPLLSVPFPGLGGAALPAEEHRLASLIIPGHGRATTRRRAGSFHFIPSDSVPFPGIAEPIELRPASVISAKQQNTPAFAIKGHGGFGTREWAGRFDLKPLLSIPLPGVAQQLVVFFSFAKKRPVAPEQHDPLANAVIGQSGESAWAWPGRTQTVPAFPVPLPRIGTDLCGICATEEHNPLTSAVIGHGMPISDTNLH